MTDHVTIRTIWMYRRGITLYRLRWRHFPYQTKPTLIYKQTERRRFCLKCCTRLITCIVVSPVQTPQGYMQPTVLYGCVSTTAAITCTSGKLYIDTHYSHKSLRCIRQIAGVKGTARFYDYFIGSSIQILTALCDIAWLGFIYLNITNRIFSIPFL